MPETNGEKIRIKVRRRAIKFEKGVRTSTDRLILKECLKEKKRNMEGEGIARKEKNILCEMVIVNKE